MTNPIIFNVEEGATRTMTLQGTVGGVSLVSTFDLYVYRFNDAIQQYEQFRVQKGWINTLLLAGQSQPLTPDVAWRRILVRAEYRQRH